MEFYLHGATEKIEAETVICWWSGGITSALACKIAIGLYGRDACRIVMIDTKNEHPDTYRFFDDCQSLYGKDIEVISAIGEGAEYKYSCIQDVWEDYLSLNVAHGAICSSELKRQVRLQFQRKEKITYQVFGYDTSEPGRALGMSTNYPGSNAIYPLLLYGISKERTAKIITDAWGIELPEPYILGYRNNNCFNTGCVQGGIGYWQKIMRERPRVWEAMGELERKLTKEKGVPVTCLKDQSNAAKAEGRHNVFLLPNEDYPEYRHLAQVKGRPVEALPECNGFCSTPPSSSTVTEITYKDKSINLF